MKLKTVIILLAALALSSHTATSSRVLICEVVAKTTIYDCSNLGMEWSDLERSLIEPTRTATSLNLAANNLGTTIANKTFNVFKLLDHTLNMSSNKIARVDSHGFFVNPDLNSLSERLDPLRITALDLSFNSFEIIPWNSVKSLFSLERFYFNGK